MGFAFNQQGGKHLAEVAEALLHKSANPLAFWARELVILFPLQMVLISSAD